MEWAFNLSISVPAAIVGRVNLITFRGPIEPSERSSITVTARFRDRDQFVDITPTTVHWRIDSERRQQIADWTSIDPDSSVDVEITAEQNRILNETRASEGRILTVMADRGLATQFSAA